MPVQEMIDLLGALLEGLDPDERAEYFTALKYDILNTYCLDCGELIENCPNQTVKPHYRPKTRRQR